MLLLQIIFKKIVLVLRQGQARIGIWMVRRRQRHLLATLPPYLLKDIGISDYDRWQESSKPFWRP